MLVTPVMAVLIGFVGALALITVAFLLHVGIARVGRRRVDLP